MGIFRRLFGSIDREGQKRQKFRELDQQYAAGSEEFVNNLKATWLVSRANYYGDRGMLDEALEDLEAALGLKSDHLAAHVSRVLVYAKRGAAAKARQLVAEMPEEMKIDGTVVGRKADLTEVLARIKG